MLAAMEHTRLPPQRLAPDTWLVRSVAGVPGGDAAIPVNSLVIGGREPVLVDTGARATWPSWCADAFSLVDPGAVRWVVLSHADADHAGNLELVLDRCPGATVAASGTVLDGLAAAGRRPERCRRLGNGEVLALGDRRLRAHPPPVADAPGTLGVLDESTGVYWAADAFGVPVAAGADVPTEVRDLEPASWAEGAVLFAQRLDPTVAEVDPERWRSTLRGMRELCATTLASAHGPPVGWRQVDAAIGLLRSLPRRPPTPAAAGVDLHAALLAGVPA